MYFLIREPHHKGGILQHLDYFNKLLIDMVLELLELLENILFIISLCWKKVTPSSST
jgi:hypothetical protein